MTILFLLFIILPLLRPFLSRRFGNVAVVSVTGPIQFSNDPRSGYAQLMHNLRIVWKARPAVMVLRINSPGGTVGASYEIYRMVKDIEERGTRVVALMEDVAASGGLYVAMAARMIFATPGTITGSIGVIMHGREYSAALEWLKIRSNTIKSGALKDAGSPDRPMNEADRAMLQSVIDDAYNEFCEVVSVARKIPMEKVREFADGRILTGNQAKKLGLVDEVGGFEDVLNFIAQALGVKREQLRPYILANQTSFFGSLGARLGLPLTAVDTIIGNPDLSGIPLYMMERR